MSKGSVHLVGFQGDKAALPVARKHQGACPLPQVGLELNTLDLLLTHTPPVKCENGHHKGARFSSVGN